MGALSRDAFGDFFFRTCFTWSRCGPSALAGVETSRKVGLFVHREVIPCRAKQKVERNRNLTWESQERPDGSITGTSNRVAVDKGGRELFGGREALLGARGGDRILLEEAVDIESDASQVITTAAPG